jgi:MFS family permease
MSDVQHTDGPGTATLAMVGDAPQDSRRWRMLPVVLSATFMVIFDFFVVNVAAPSLQSGLHASQAELQLIIGSYAFSFASALITGGRLGDLYGHRRLFLLGIGSFALASLLCALAQSPWELVAARVLQGLTGAAMVPQVLAIITRVFPARERSRALSWFGATMGAGAVGGQVLGGVLLSAHIPGLGWRIIFLVNVPIGLVAVLIGRRVVTPAPPTARPKLDPAGAIGISGSLALAMLPLVVGRSAGWPPWAWALMAASVPLMVLTLAWERSLARRGGQPLIDVSLFRIRSFSAGLGVNIGIYAFWGSLIFALTLVFQDGLKLTPLRTGLAFGPFGLAFAVATLLTGPAVARYGRRVTVAGTIVSAIALVELLIEFPRIGVTQLVVPLIIIGFGNGLAMPTMVGSVLSGVDPRQAGAASGVLVMSQQFSVAAGTAVLGALFFSVLGADPGRADYADALRGVVLVCVILVALAAALASVVARPASGRH